MPEISSPITGEFVATKKVPIKGALELGNVDNTSDADKPVSTLTQAALDDKADTTALTNGLAGKADSDHPHSLEDVVLLETRLSEKIGSDAVTAGTGAIAITNMVVISETDYNALAEPDANTVYLIIEDPAP